ncbi:unnamed protein product, partial [Sphacelaria rigidula]
GSNSAEENAKAGEKDGVGAAEPPAAKGGPLDVDDNGMDAVGEKDGGSRRAECFKSATAMQPITSETPIVPSSSSPDDPDNESAADPSRKSSPAPAADESESSSESSSGAKTGKGNGKARKFHDDMEV